MKITKKQYQLFIDKAHGFIEVFGLKDWDISFEFGGTDSGDQASVVFHLGNRVCTFNFSTTSRSKLSDKKISKIAFHEVCELFFAEFRIHMDRQPEITDQIIHAKIRTLENILYSSMVEDDE